MSTNIGVMNGKEAFIQNIASRLGRKEPLKSAPLDAIQGVPDHYRAIDLSMQEKIDVFVHHWTTLSGRVLIVTKAEAKQKIAAYLAEIIEELQVKAVSMWEHEQLAALDIEQIVLGLNVEAVPWRVRDVSLGEAEATANATAATTVIGDKHNTNWSTRTKLLQATEQCQLGIVYPQHVIANTSTLVLQARGGQGRSVSLLPSSLLAIFPADHLVTRMGEALQLIRDAYPSNLNLPSSINMITGPSRSADIENDLTIGVHGPGKVFAIIVV